MFKRFLPAFIAFNLSIGFVAAQVPEAVIGITPSGAESVSAVCTGAAQAGSTVRSLRNSRSTDRRFLCLGDTLVVNHQGDFNLSEDPNTGTAPGIAYIFYDRPPTISGPRWGTVRTDPSRTSRNFNGIPPTEGVWITRGQGNGNMNLPNTGALQTGFQGGAPVKFYFAPVTLYGFNNVPSPSGEGDTACVHVNINDRVGTDTFSVVFLNAIATSNATVTSASTGSFLVRGGLPEYDGSGFFVSITLQSNAAITGTVTSGAALHNTTVTYSVPQNGTYNVRVFDGKSCESTFTVTLPASSFALRTDSVTCSGLSTGRLRIVPSTLNAPYSYTWRSQSNAALTGTGNIALNDSAVIANLPAGIYNVTVTNTLGQTTTGSIEIYQPSPLFINSPTVTNPRCAGETNGQLAITTTGGGTQPYSFAWSNGATTRTITGLGQGSYTCTMTDAKGCRDSIRVSIGVNPISITSSSANPATCTGVNNGSISIGGATGGTTASGNYTFRWSNAQTNTGSSSSLTNLAPGRYFLTITDDNNCTKVDSFTVGTSRALELTASFGNVTCNGLRNGFVNASVSTRGVEVRPYTFAWTGGVGTPSNTATSTLVTSLGAGTYSLNVRDGGGCTLDSIFLITQPDSINITLANLTNESCQTPNNGSIRITVTGGSPFTRGYVYRWSHNTTDTTANITGLAAGSYTVTVSDSLGCSKTRTYTVTAPQRPQFNRVVVTSTRCFGDSTGGARVFYTSTIGQTITGYSWNTGATIDSIINVPAGMYYVTVTQSDGCTRRDSVNITSNPRFYVDTARIQRTNPNCPGFPTGSITVFGRGGVSPYSYQLIAPNVVQPFPVFAQLAAGTYQFKLTDNVGCTDSASVTLTDPPKIVAAFDQIQAVSCYEKCNPGDGRARVTASSGTVNNGQYNFTWGSTEETVAQGFSLADSLCGGWQFVTITDGQCTVVDSVNIPRPEPLTFAAPTITVPRCNGDNNGAVTVSNAGGTPPYSYIWNTGGNTASISNIGAGRYTVRAIDNKLCSKDLVVDVQEPDILELLADLDSVSCYNLSDGQISLQRTGGNTGATNYLWSPSVSQTGVASNLRAGIYKVTATDINGCADSMELVLTQPSPIYFFMQPPSQPRCYGEQTTLKIDTAFGSYFAYPYTFSIDNGPQYPIGYPVPIFANDQIRITIIEQTSGCSLDSVIAVGQPDPVRVYFDTLNRNSPVPFKINIGLGDSIRLNPRIVSALPIDSVVWTPKDYLSFTGDPLRPYAKPLDDRIYTLTVFDINGCRASEKIEIELDRNRNIFVPNIFTPDGLGDDNNNYFSIFGGAGVKIINYVNVYDRWGELVHSRTNFLPDVTANTGWDGKYKGKPVSAGVYVYIMQVTFEDNTTLLFRGDVTLMR